MDIRCSFQSKPKKRCNRLSLFSVFLFLCCSGCNAQQVTTPTATALLTASVPLATPSLTDKPITPTPSLTIAFATLTQEPIISNETDTPEPTATPAPTLQRNIFGKKNGCLEADPALKPYFALSSNPETIYPINLETPILQFLNSGGTFSALREYLFQNGWSDDRFIEEDLTNDKILDLLVINGNLHIFTCKNHKYYTAADLSPYFIDAPQVLAIEYMNPNKKPDIVVSRVEDENVNYVNDYQILEWDGEKFQNLILLTNEYEQDLGWLSIGGTGGTIDERNFSLWHVADINNDGLKELILKGGVAIGMQPFANGPWREETIIYGWDNKNFSLYSFAFAPPTYRFQAIQDADIDMLKEKYDKALTLYHQVISSDTLAWWSSARQKYEADDLLGGSQTMPSPDPDEQPNLAAYAYYRIMLLYLLQNQPSKAQETYQLLQTQYPTGVAGNAYTNLATQFWNDYQLSHNIGSACTQAIDYASAHSTEILGYIGSQHHGWQNRLYEPKDICPFK